MNSADQSKPEDSLESLLNTQYHVIEEFANAQSQLFNVATKATVSTDTHDDIERAVHNLAIRRTAVRSIMVKLSQNEEIKERYASHIGLSQRVCRTILTNPDWSENGLPLSSHLLLESNTVALATLKASMTEILSNSQYSS